jgi:hypothetical protein
MAEIQISDTVILRLPDNVIVEQAPLLSRRSITDQSDALDAALVAGGLTLEAKVRLTPSAMSAAPPRRDGSRAEAPSEVSVSVGEGESAAVLIESQGGVFGWLYPDEQPRGRRRSAGQRTLTFSLTHPAAGGANMSGRRGILSWAAGLLVQPLKVRVLKFFAGIALDAAVNEIEGHRPFGLVDMNLPLGAWKAGSPFPKLAARRPATILLMIHGTFSTSAGSFGGLGLTKEGQAFLEQAKSQYDAILGFDHSTLAKDPLENATDILEALQDLPNGSSIDAVAFSRGGLVLRTLAEDLVPAQRPDLTFRRAVFVGCTNAGTHLAEPKNWHDLVDLYTNIIAAGARAISLLSANVAAEIIAAGISTIGQFVKLLPDLAITGKRLPGLAAMEPDGQFVQALNNAQPAAGGADYRVIASDFEPRIDLSKGITGELAEYMINRVADRLFRGVENDLVVDTTSMWTFGAHENRLGRNETFVIPASSSIYHTIYFASVEVAERLGAWLGADERGRRGPPVSPRARDTKRPPPPDDLGYRGDFDDTMSAAPSAGGDDSGPHGAGGYAGNGEGSAHDDGSQVGTASQGGSGPGSGYSRDARSDRRRGPVRNPRPSRPADDFACHFAAEMEPAPLLGLATPLFVTVSPERIATAGGPTSFSTIDAAHVDRMKPITIAVIASRNCLVLGPAPEGKSARNEGTGSVQRDIEVPTTSSISLRFEILGVGPGEAEIFVEARQGPRLLASFLLKPMFTAQLHERLTASQVARPTASLEDDPAVLRIYEMHRAEGGLRLRFELSSERPNILVQQDVDLRPNFNVGAFVAMFLAKLENAYNCADYEATLEEITAFSKVRTIELIPERVRQTLWNHRNDIKAIQVISEEPLIPWELLCISDPANPGSNKRFLAEMGLVRWMYNASWPTRQLPLREGRLFSVIPDYLDPRYRLKGARDERDMLEGMFPGVTSVAATSRDVCAFLEKRGAKCDLIHFACHGLADQQAVLSSDLVMEGFERGGSIVEDRLTQEAVKVAATFGKDSPAGIIFVNACQTGRQGEGIAGVVGFAESFIRPMSQNGANAFVGALWSVDDRLALTFAETLYGELKKGETFVAAANSARNACKKNRDFTWLAYSLYGHPFARAEFH